MRICLLALTLLVSIVVAGCGGSDDSTTARTASAEPSAASWKPWVLSSASEVAVPPPPRADSAAALRDVRELDRAVKQRSRALAARARTQEQRSVVEPWLGRAMRLVSQREKNPPASSRAYGLVSVAMHDAMIAAYHWMYR